MDGGLWRSHAHAERANERERKDSMGASLPCEALKGDLPDGKAAKRRNQGDDAARVGGNSVVVL